MLCKFLSEIDLFKQLSDSCLETLEKDSNVLRCSAGHLFFPARSDWESAVRSGEGPRSRFQNLCCIA
jgi:hypothetical protein